MNYPPTQSCLDLLGQLQRVADLQHEYGAKGLEPLIRRVERTLARTLKQVQALPVDQARARQEPNSLAAIRALRPKGPRRLWAQLDRKPYADRLAGAFLARCAGCTLGAPVEGWAIDRMERLARETGMPFPPDDYWKRVPDPYVLRYNTSRREDYTRGKMKGVPVDDDVAYTLLGLLIVEAYGPGFTVAQVGQAWLKYLPLAYTAEKVTLENLKKGIPAAQAGDPKRGNPFCEWIGADIRADPWGYLAAGWPEKAAEMAYRDATLSHRRNGIYGEMFFAAAIAAAFTVDDPMEALEIGLTEIPRDCATARSVRWALKTAPGIKTYQEAAAAVDEKFKGMNRVHTINNACLTVFGLAIGGTDVSRVIAETVAMGYDNDCTAATAGSIVGAVVGRKGIPARWTRPFGNTVRSYLTGEPGFRIDDLLRRFTIQAKRIHGR